MYQFFQGLSCNKPNIDLCMIQHSAWFWKVNFHDILCLLQDITTDNSVQQQFHQFLRCLCNHRCINPAFYEKRLKQCLPTDRKDYSFATSNVSFKAILTASKLLVFGSVPATVMVEQAYTTVSPHRCPAICIQIKCTETRRAETTCAKTRLPVWQCHHTLQKPKTAVLFKNRTGNRTDF